MILGDYNNICIGQDRLPQQRERELGGHTLLLSNLPLVTLHFIVWAISMATPTSKTAGKSASHESRRRENQLWVSTNSVSKITKFIEYTAYIITCTKATYIVPTF